ncbi:hypothetical protein CSAL01_10392 [Colletotrichum salicis]|uniref:Uncharacterized protein n=1 Tax=Colletotrichum salicis TaxID=1209931 RepID=A0A135U522_9PEZI|nr:hypothetical protein CSAL01_10392 [Colletotrichum salicis]
MPPSSTGAVCNFGHNSGVPPANLPASLPYRTPDALPIAPPSVPTPTPAATPPTERPIIPVSSDSAYSINRYVDTPIPSDRQIRAPLFTSPLPSPSPEEAELAGSVRMEALLKEIYPNRSD